MTKPDRQSWLTTAPAYILVTDDSGKVVDCNHRVAEAMHRDTASLVDPWPLADFLSPDSSRLVAQLDRRELLEKPHQCCLTIRDQSNKPIVMHAVIDAVPVNNSDAPYLRLTMLPDGSASGTATPLRRDHDMLDSIISASSEALWCIEYVEPVDLTAPEDEVIRQFFDSMCFWRILNPAMQELYKMPLERDIRSEDVRFIFPKNAENEEFVRNLFANRFHLDKAVSRDKLYDDTWITAENDVRSYIHENRLIRLWGTVRPIGGLRWKGKNLELELDKLSSILSAVPEPVLVLDKSGRLAAANPAVEWHFGWSIDDILGQPADRWIPGLTLVDLAETSDAPNSEIDVSVLCGDGSQHHCVCRVGRHGLTMENLFAVLVLRPTEKRPLNKSKAESTEESERSDALL